MRRALISVSDKNGIVAFAKELANQGIEIISTGGTKRALEEAGVATVGIEEVTGFPEMLDGRVKTLHPKIHGGLLARRDLDSHLSQLAAHDIQPIDFVCVNLYPFAETISKPDVTLDEAIENIDIGGPSMLRSAAKNYAAVTVITDPADYDRVLAELKADGETTLATRKELAAKVFAHTSAYDGLIARYLGNRETVLRYGENPQQQASFIRDAEAPAFSIAAAKQLNGKELSYNNIRDADAGLRMIREYSEPTVVAIKHMNPCGIGTADTIFGAFQKAFDADPVSIFGGIVILNRPVDLATAEKLSAIFLEIIVAPAFEPEALALLSKKKNLRLLQLDFSSQNQHNAREFVSVLGGYLEQDMDTTADDPAAWQCVTERQPTEEEMRALAFNWKAVKHVKSNAIVLGTASQTLGIGAGQMNRIGSLKIAAEQAGARTADCVLASDAFFPMDDSVAFAAEHGIRAIVQPGGSIKDQDSIDMANKHGIAMVFTGVRHFKH